MNPARTFGPDLVGGNFSHYLVYVAGPIAGAAVAVFIAFVLRGRGGGASGSGAGQGALFTESQDPGAGQPAEQRRRPMSHDRSHAMDHVVLVLFENRSLDNMLGRLYGPEDGKTFDGVIGKDLSNPIPEWAEHGAERKTVPYTVGDRHGCAEPGLGRGVLPHQHPALQHPRRAQPLQDRRGRNRAVERSRRGAVPTMDGFVTDYISTFTARWAASPPTRSTRRS